METSTMIDTLKDSGIFSLTTLPKGVAAFDERELSLSGIIGQGEFGEVCSVLAIEKAKPSGHSSSPMIADEVDIQTSVSPEKEESDSRIYDGKSSSIDSDQTKILMAERCVREGGVPRYAIKRMKSSFLDNQDDGEIVEMAAQDLAFEAKLLAKLDHCNIVKLRATSGTPGTKDFMIILDQLICVLDKKVIQWKEADSKCRGLFKRSREATNRQCELEMERLIALYDIARAIRYLHKHHILFRDLKPENVGCDVRGTFKLFDFGLARTLKQEELVQKPDEYDLTGLCGSRRWMAPENALCLNYGFSADVYSYSLLFWHVMAMKLPFENFDHRKHFQKVIRGGHRPLARKMRVSKFMKTFVVDGWGTDPTKRPTMSRLCEVIGLEIRILQKEGTSKAAPRGSKLIDRSRHLMDQSLKSLKAFKLDDA